MSLHPKAQVKAHTFIILWWSRFKHDTGCPRFGRHMPPSLYACVLDFYLKPIWSFSCETFRFSPFKNPTMYYFLRCSIFNNSCFNVRNSSREEYTNSKIPLGTIKQTVNLITIFKIGILDEISSHTKTVDTPHRANKTSLNRKSLTNNTGDFCKQ